MDRKLDQTDDNLRFLGELNRRSEIVLQDFLRANAATRADIRKSISETEARTREIESRTRENTEASKAHTRAIFALIDRLEGGSGPLAPAG